MMKLVLAGVLGAGVPRAYAAGNYASDAGIGTACVFVNLLYMPAKFVVRSAMGHVLLV